MLDLAEVRSVGPLPDSLADRNDSPEDTKRLQLSGAADQLTRLRSCSGEKKLLPVTIASRIRVRTKGRLGSPSRSVRPLP